MIAPLQTRRRWRPAVTFGLIAANVLAYAWTAAIAHSVVDNQDSATFLKLCLSFPATAAGWWWTTMTSGFLHFGPVHLLVNMYSLYVLGATVEAGLGRARYLAVYAISLLGGSAAVLWWAIEAGGVTAGASGAIFGVMGAELVMVLAMRLNPANILIVIVANVVVSMAVPGVSLYAHLGGLVTGVVVAAGFVYGPRLLRGQARTARSAARIGWAVTVAAAAVIVVAVVVRFEDLHGVRIYTLGG
ncbi:rhomboid family intramembrane serine protease [Tsukamurella soli]|uniref:Peptidase S54 rhomboid domain-containing protein n=1 Tax=Tsukamurella soli TaxID=644556 RepID=A0ABP8J028_9ACTN